MPTPATAGDPLDTLARRLDYLFRTIHLRGHRPYSNDQAAAAITGSGIHISSNYIWALRRGHRDNPTLHHLEGLAKFFGVETTFLVSTATAERMRHQLDALYAEPTGPTDPLNDESESIDARTLSFVDALLEQAKHLVHGLRDAGSS